MNQFIDIWASPDGEKKDYTVINLNHIVSIEMDKKGFKITFINGKVIYALYDIISLKALPIDIDVVVLNDIWKKNNPDFDISELEKLNIEDSNMMFKLFPDNPNNGYSNGKRKTLLLFITNLLKRIDQGKYDTEYQIKARKNFLWLCTIDNIQIFELLNQYGIEEDQNKKIELRHQIETYRNTIKETDNLKNAYTEFLRYYPSK